ncbi:MAG: hypothetical protein AAF702_27175 [Chloroflexota bacterium]
MTTEESRKVTLPKHIDQTVQAFQGVDGDTVQRLRQDVITYASSRFSNSQSDIEVPADLVAYLDKVALQAYKITDADVESLQAKGYSDDAIFELTVGASLGVGVATWQEGIQAIDAFFDAEEERNHAA